MNKENLNVDITSLLDILVILLVFLLKSYNASDLTIDLAKNVNLPKSQSSNLGHDSVIIQVNKERKLFINNDPIGTGINTLTLGKIKNHLADHYKKKTKELKERKIASMTDLQKETFQKKQKQKEMVNLVFDSSIPYHVMERIMNVASKAGYKQFKFIVLGGKKS